MLVRSAVRTALTLKSSPGARAVLNFLISFSNDLNVGAHSTNIGLHSTNIECWCCSNNTQVQPGCPGRVEALAAHRTLVRLWLSAAAADSAAPPH
jgi:hypothetical protein